MKSHVLLFALGLSLALTSCGRRVYEQSNNYIIIQEEERKENFTNDQLRNYIKKNNSPTIVVRSSGQTGSIASSSSSDRVCSILEMALAKNNFDVRDRSLFESVATARNQTAISYKDIYDATNVDLLLEITSISLNDYYSVDGFYVNKEKYERFPEVEYSGNKIHPRYVFRGMSLTIKVIVLKDNIVGGSYSYSYIPCSRNSGGALITQMYPLRYRVSGDARDLDAILDDKDNSGLIERQSQRLDRTMESFLTNVVIPGMMNDIIGSTATSLSKQVTISDPEPTQQPAQQLPAPSIKLQPNASEPKSNPNNKVISVDNIDEVFDELFALAEDLKEKKTVKKLSLLLLKYKSASAKNTRAAKEAIEDVIDDLNDIRDDLEEELGKKPVTRKTPQTKPEKTVPAYVPVNSYGNISSAISSFIDQQATNQFEKERAILESNKKNTHTLTENYLLAKTDLKKSEFLNHESLSELNRFVSVSTALVGTSLPQNADGVVFFLPMNTQSKLKDENESVLLVFLDEQCIGVGTFFKGFYIKLAKDNSDNAFHQLKVYALSDNKKEPIVGIFDATIKFDIRDTYEFVPEVSKGKIKELRLK